MINLVNETNIYDLNFITSYPKFLIFTKNILRILSKKGAIKHNSKYVFPLRWSIKKQCFVIDFRSLKQRDIEGIDLNNIQNFYDREELNDILIKNILSNCNLELELHLENFRFKKNESKFLALSYDKKYIELQLLQEKVKFDILGIYNFTEYKSRQGVFTSSKNRSILIDNHLECLNNIYAYFQEDCCNSPKIFKIDNYLEKYSKVKNKLDKIYDLEKDYKKTSVLLSEALCSFILKNLKVEHNLICYDENIMKNIVIKRKLNKNMPNNNIMSDKEVIVYNSFIPRVF